MYRCSANSRHVSRGPRHRLFGGKAETHSDQTFAASAKAISEGYSDDREKQERPRKITVSCYQLPSVNQTACIGVSDDSRHVYFIRESGERPRRCTVSFTLVAVGIISLPIPRIQTHFINPQIRFPVDFLKRFRWVCEIFGYISGASVGKFIWYFLS